MLIAYKIRADTEDDRNFILSSWLRSFRNNGDWPRHIDSATYYANHQSIIQRLLVLCDVRVACAADDENLILGWCCVDGSIVHYVFVKEQYRKLGIAKALLSGLEDKAEYTHWTRIIKDLDHAGKLLGLRYNPYILLGWGDG